MEKMEKTNETRIEPVEQWGLKGCAGGEGTIFELKLL